MNIGGAGSYVYDAPTGSNAPPAVGDDASGQAEEKKTFAAKAPSKGNSNSNGRVTLPCDGLADSVMRGGKSVFVSCQSISVPRQAQTNLQPCPFYLKCFAHVNEERVSSHGSLAPPAGRRAALSREI